MYKVFINDISISFQSINPIDKNIVVIGSILDYGTNSEEIIYRLRQSHAKSFAVVTEFIELEWKQMCTIFKFVQAAGGLVLNKNEDILFIKRNDVWDLPKGHVEKGERLSETALREVVEECGDLQLEITRFLTATYHIYWFKEQWRLKETTWYLMDCSEVNQLIPQREEGIEEVTFVNKKGLKNIYSSTYPNIISVIEAAGFSVA
ncbi:NUDIX domain-containing protein [Flavobacteriaceae bacterium]|nr:NUDIX domain-containing protein [Flavobacteriaceae bacterium]